MANIYTPKEVADLLKMDVQTIRAYIRKGKLKASKIGKEYRVTEEQLTTFLKENETN